MHSMFTLFILPDRVLPEYAAFGEFCVQRKNSTGNVARLKTRSFILTGPPPSTNFFLNYKENTFCILILFNFICDSLIKIGFFSFLLFC